eukprot:GHVT01058811.1.p1 GENE.GHVT01058811.1~~GHVT01058811.1.p1  ORF type:complete len:839 (-),score=68.18 GHVT01058811.1:402-2918(-)
MSSLISTESTSKLDRRRSLEQMLLEEISDISESDDASESQDITENDIDDIWDESGDIDGSEVSDEPSEKSRMPDGTDATSAVRGPISDSDVFSRDFHKLALEVRRLDAMQAKEKGRSHRKERRNMPLGRCSTSSDAASSDNEGESAEMSGGDVPSFSSKNVAASSCSGRDISTRRPVPKSPRKAVSDIQSRKGDDGDAPCVVEDFVRNFLLRRGMRKTFAQFEAECYELPTNQEHKDNSNAPPGSSNGQSSAANENDILPDVYAQNEQLEMQLDRLRSELLEYRGTAAAQGGKTEELQKKVDFHSMHHRRVVQEKKILLRDLCRWQRRCEQFEPILQELRNKHKVAMKGKMLMQLDRDRYSAKLRALEEELVPHEKREQTNAKPLRQAPPVPPAEGRRRSQGAAVHTKSRPKIKTSGSAVDGPPRRRLDVATLTAEGTVQVDDKPVSCVALHPKLPIAATGTDSGTWRTWHLPQLEPVMTAEAAHSRWVSSVAFHPTAPLLATAGGDSVIRIWQLDAERCVAQITEHSQAVRDIKISPSGVRLFSASLDRTIRVFDTANFHRLQLLRGHVDGVNAISCFPTSSSELIASASTDKSVSLWETRTGKCVATYYGHGASVVDVAVDPSGTVVASCDAAGLVCLWDVKMTSELARTNVGSLATNCLVFDGSGEYLAIGSGVEIKIFDVQTLQLQKDVKAHTDAIQVGHMLRGAVARLLVKFETWIYVGKRKMYESNGSALAIYLQLWVSAVISKKHSSGYYSFSCCSGHCTGRTAESIMYSQRRRYLCDLWFNRGPGNSLRTYNTSVLRSIMLQTALPRVFDRFTTLQTINACRQRLEDYCT